MPSLSVLVRYLDRTLKPATTSDWPGAINGLQIENNGRVTKIGVSVDAHEPALRAAIAEKVDLLLVHHGLFWQSLPPLIGARKRKLQLAFDHNLAVYSSHLPLDLHPRWGNNALLARALGWRRLRPFFVEKGQPIGFQTSLHLSRSVLARQLEKATGRKALILPGGPATVRRVGLVTGGAGAEVARAAAEGVDTFITGEGPQHTYGLAHELGINVIYGGHYATETFGVKALGQHLSQKYRVPWTFLDFPCPL